MKELIEDIINQLINTTEPIIRIGVYYNDKQIQIPDVITFEDVKELLIIDLQNYVNSLPDEVIVENQSMSDPTITLINNQDEPNI